MRAASLVWAATFPAKDVSQREVGQVEVLGQEHGLSPFAATLGTHDQELTHAEGTPTRKTSGRCSLIRPHLLVDPIFQLHPINIGQTSKIGPQSLGAFKIDVLNLILRLVRVPMQQHSDA